MFDFYNQLMNTKMSKPVVMAIFAFALVYCLMGNGILPAGTTDYAPTPAAQEAPVVEASEEPAETSADHEYQDYENIAYAWTSWDAISAPDYYRVDGRAIEAYQLTEGQITYNGLDELGRTTWAGGILTGQMRADAKARGRQDFNAECDKITGWGYNDKVVIPSTNGGKDYRGYMFNRSHLVADSLGGDPLRENLITGTRCQNVGNNDNSGGMAYTEEMAREYLDSNPNGSIYYAATPVYDGDEMVPRSVYVDIKSDDGSIDEHVEVYNVAMGYTVNYATGEFSEN